MSDACNNSECQNTQCTNMHCGCDCHEPDYDTEWYDQRPNIIVDGMEMSLSWGNDLNASDEDSDPQPAEHEEPCACGDPE